MGLSILKYVANTKTMHRFENWAVKERPVKNSMSKTVTNYTKLQEIYPTVAMLLAVGSQTAFIYNSKDMQA